jgi:hypothetical protein
MMTLQFLPSSNWSQLESGLEFHLGAPQIIGQFPTLLMRFSEWQRTSAGEVEIPACWLVILVNEIEAMSPLCWTLPVSHVAKIPFVPVPRRNPETSPCEVRKSVRDSFGVPRTLEVVAVVKGVARAQRAVDDFTNHLTEAEKKSGVFLCWEYTKRRIDPE